MQKIGLIAIGTLLTPVLGTPALGITLELDGAGDFSNPFGVAAGTALSTSSLNTSSGIAGFDRFFTSSFGRLGANIGGTTTGVESGTVNRYTNDPIVFLEEDLSFESQRVRFNYAFDGNAPSNTDVFSAYFALYDTLQSSEGPVFLTREYAPSGGIGGFEVSSTYFTAGTEYALVFALQESLGSGNSGAGFDDVSITSIGAPNPVPFEFSPGLGILALGAWGAITQLNSKVQKRKFFESGSLTSNDGQAESV